jgi:hypothetical protein
MQNSQISSPKLQVPAQGPVEIDIQLLQLVSGGLPKSGWIVGEAEVSALPKSGW